MQWGFHLSEEDAEVGVAGGQFGDVIGADGISQLVVEHHPLLPHLLYLIQQPLQFFDARFVFTRLNHLEQPRIIICSSNRRHNIFQWILRGS